MIRLASLAAALAALLGAAPAAHATYSCTVPATSDGFVALRATPSTKGKIIARMRPDQVVVVATDDQGNMIEKGNWTKAMHFPGEVMPNPGDEGYEKVKSGWMWSKFVVDCG